MHRRTAALASLLLAAQPHAFALRRRGTEAAPAAGPNYARRVDVTAAALAFAEMHALEPDWVQAQLAQARYVPAVAQLMMPPASPSARNWTAYRARMVDARRIEAGRQWWSDNQAWLDAAEQRWAVPAEIVVGIVGVETYYGRVTGTFRVLDALATLSFDFPTGRSDRSPFFRAELGHFLRLARGKAPAQPAFALRTKGDARRQPQADVGDQALGESERIALPLNPKEGVHAGVRRGEFDSGQCRELRHERVAAFFQPLHQRRNRVACTGQCGDPGALHERRRARRIEFDELAQCVHRVLRRDQPAQAPARHHEALRKTVRDDEPVVGQRDVEETRRAALSGNVIEPLIDFVGDDPGAGAPAVREERLLLGAAQRPAGRVVRRVHEQHARLGSHHVEQALQVQAPRAGLGSKRYGLDDGAEDSRLRSQVRPDRHDGNDFVTRVEQGLHREHQRIHAARRDGDSIHWNRAVQPARVGGECLAQLGQAEVVCVKRFSRGDGARRRFAHVRRRCFIALAEPERKHVAAADSGVRDFANLRRRQLFDCTPHA